MIAGEKPLRPADKFNPPSTESLTVGCRRTDPCSHTSIWASAVVSTGEEALLLILLSGLMVALCVNAKRR